MAERLASRERTELVTGLRRLAAGRPARAGAPRGPGGRPPTPSREACDLCGNEVPADHRHLLELTERRILCTCESCWALRSGDAELRPVGTRVVWLDEFELPDDLWARLEIPIGLAFVLRNGSGDGAVALYPSPAGATESELELSAWRDLCEANPVLEQLEPDAEALIVNRLADPAQHAIAPIDECYRLVGTIKLAWEGISGGAGPERAVAGFFEQLRERATA